MYNYRDDIARNKTGRATSWLLQAAVHGDADAVAIAIVSGVSFDHNKSIIRVAPGDRHVFDAAPISTVRTAAATRILPAIADLPNFFIFRLRVTPMPTLISRVIQKTNYTRIVARRARANQERTFKKNVNVGPLQLLH